MKIIGKELLTITKIQENILIKFGSMLEADVCYLKYISKDAVHRHIKGEFYKGKEYLCSLTFDTL